MEYFDRIEFTNRFERHVRMADALSDILQLWPNLGVGDFDQKTVEYLVRTPWYEAQPALTKKIVAPVENELDKLGIKNPALRKSMLEVGSRDAMQVLNEVRGLMIQPNISGCDPEAFVFNEFEVSLSKEWEDKLKAKYTFKPESIKQKRFAELAAEIEKNYNELRDLLPSGIPVFGEGGTLTKPLFRLQGNRIEFINTEHIRSIR